MAKKRAMPRFTPAPDALVRRFNDAIAGVEGVQTRKMFGYPAAFLNGNMFTGLFRGSMIIRLDESDRQSLMKTGGQPFEPMSGRPMREYVVVPAKVIENARDVGRWLERSASYVATLKPKKKK
jgi:TfoX/Sxy family transcriptional regulator of competence genes